ncbi:MAG TPA: Na-translocating system protein MpsC family protein [Solirubrobacteraceae bacterium]|nr:Na-translocating system protein MpsC family protein [Solirubrobacteraceae bacterium]
MLHDVLSQAERTLANSDQADIVVNVRHLYQKTMQVDFVAAVERLTGRRVTAFISGNHIDPDIAVELFVLDGPVL